MAYELNNKKIILNKTSIEFMYKYFERKLQDTDFNDIEKNLYCNSMVLYYLLHEIEHANQLKKVLEGKDTFERLLLLIDNYIFIEFNKKSKVKQLFVGFDNKLCNDLKLMKTLQNKYSNNVPCERMASIYGLKDVISIIQKIKTDIPNVTNQLKCYLTSIYLQGYDFNQNIFSPTERYIEDFKNLNVSNKNGYINEKMLKGMYDAKKSSLDERLTFGLTITKEEYNETKKLSINNNLKLYL